MKSWYLLGLWLLPVLAQAQASRLVKKRSRYFVEQFAVQTEARSVREGDYQKVLLDGNKLMESGQYEAGQRVGVWTFYDWFGKPELVYDYTQKLVILTNRRDENSSVTQIWVGDTMRTVIVDTNPVYLASSMQILQTLSHEVLVPVSLMQGRVNELSYKVLAIVSPAGTTFQMLVSNADSNFSKKIKQAVDMAFDGVEWVPATYQQAPVTATYLLPEMRIVMMGRG